MNKQEILNSIVKVITGKTFMNFRKPLETLFKPNTISFQTEPIPMYNVKHNLGTIVIVNKEYVTQGDNDILINDKYVIGFL